MLVSGEREAMVLAPPAMCDSAVSPSFCGCLAFLHRHFPPQPPPPHPLDLSLQSATTFTLGLFHIPKLQLPATMPPRRPGVRMALIPFRLPLISCFPLSLKCFSSDSDNCPHVRMGPLPQYSLVLLTLLLFPLVPSSYWVLRGSTYSFPLVRYSCPLTVGILHALLCLKVYFWCIHGERCTPHLSTPLPSCSLHSFLLLFSAIVYSRRLVIVPCAIQVGPWSWALPCRNVRKYTSFKVPNL